MFRNRIHVIVIIAYVYRIESWEPFQDDPAIAFATNNGIHGNETTLRMMGTGIIIIIIIINSVNSTVSPRHVTYVYRSSGQYDYRIIVFAKRQAPDYERHCDFDCFKNNHNHTAAAAAATTCGWRRASTRDSEHTYILPYVNLF
jgi:hypothetical protein